MDIGYITSGIISTQSPSRVAASTQSLSPISQKSVEDKITISNSANEFSVTSPVEDYLPQGKHISTKKKFKNLKEYMGYMMLMYNRMKKIEDKSNGFFAPLENKAEYQRLKTEMKSLSQADVIA